MAGSRGGRGKGSAATATDTGGWDRPLVTISAAMSVDGKISGPRRTTVKLSSEDDFLRVHALRARTDAIMVGINTVLSDDPMLTVRHDRILPRLRGERKRGWDADPVRVILDSRARIPLDSKIIKTSHLVETVIAVSDAAPARAVSRLRDETSAHVVVMGRKSVSIKRLFAYLLRIDIGSVLVEGGGTLNWDLVRRRLFDDLVVTVSPYLLGGGLSSGTVSLVDGRGFSGLADSPRLILRSVKQLGDHVVLWYCPADE